MADRCPLFAEAVNFLRQTLLTYKEDCAIVEENTTTVLYSVKENDFLVCHQAFNSFSQTTDESRSVINEGGWLPGHLLIFAYFTLRLDEKSK